MTTMQARPRPTYRESLQALHSAQKPPRGVSLYSIYVNRPIGRRIAALARVLGLTPNQITVLSGLTSLAGMVLLVAVPPSYGLGAGVALLLALGFALDSADGQVARLSGGGNARGEWLDHMIDCAVKLGLHLAVFIAIHHYTPWIPRHWLLVALAYQFVTILMFFGGVLTAKLLEHAATNGAPPRREGRGASSKVLLIPADHGTLCLTFFLWGNVHTFLWVYAAWLACNVVLLAAYARAWWKDLG